MAEQSVANIIREEKKKNPAEKLVDVYQGRLPKSIKDVFKVARALVVGNEVVAPVISKLAETPITNIVVKTKGKDDNPEAEEKLLKILNEILKMPDHLKGISFDNYSYSNGFSSVYFAPTRYLVCPRCKNDPKRKKSVKYRWLARKVEWKFKIELESPTLANRLQTINFYGNCPNGCKNVRFKREDRVYHNKRSLRIIRWDPYQIEIDYYRALGRSEYYYVLDDKEVKRIRAGDRIMLTEYPWSYIQAAVNNRTLRISKSGLWHFKLEGISGVYEGWGIPRLLSVLTALYTVMSIVKANEATSEGRINDLTIISPTPTRGGAMVGEDPLGAMSLQTWLSRTKTVIEKFKRDKTLTAFLPFPVHSESIYGQGRLQLVSSELQLYIRNIVAAIGLPEDVIFSGGNYTSIAVAARILANQAENARKNYNHFLNFVKDTISKSMADADFSNQVVELQPYESPDDIQKTNLMVQAAMAERFPWSPIYKRLGTNLEEVVNQMMQEVEEFSKILAKKSEAEGRSRASISAIQDYFRMQMAAENAKWMALQQNVEMAKPEQSQGDPKKREMAASQLAQSIAASYPPDTWPTIINDIAQRDPELSNIVNTFLQAIKEQASEEEQSFYDNGEAMSIAPQVKQTATRVKQIGDQLKEPDKLAPRSSRKL